jgi:biopolymer transport protein ExbD
MLMINVRKTIRGGGDKVDVNLSPLIDMVFLLLIFFVVTTSFVKEAGIEVQRSTAATAEVKERGSIMIGVSGEGEVWMEGKKVDVRSVRGLVERALAEDPEAGVVVIADKNSETGQVVQVMDQCRLAGASSVSLAAKREDGEA